jgi:hypothetical protein
MHRVASTVLAATLLLSACSSDDPVMDPSPSATDAGTPTPGDTPTATSAPTDPTESETGVDEGTEGQRFTATLTGTAEVPGPGDPNGGGAFTGTLVIGEASAQLCYQLEVTDLSSEVTAAHIHVGAAGESGPVSTALTPPIGGPVDECVTLNAEDVLALMDDPAGFYVNVHSQAHPDGAVRGQLQSGG